MAREQGQREAYHRIVPDADTSRLAQLTTVYGCSCRNGQLKVHIYANCSSLRSRSAEKKGTDRQVCYYCYTKLQKEIDAETTRIVENLEMQYAMRKRGDVEMRRIEHME